MKYLHSRAKQYLIDLYFVTMNEEQFKDKSAQYKPEFH